jgi:DNA polymerase III delta subunit
MMEAQLASQRGAAPRDVWGMNYNRFRESFPQMASRMEDYLPKDREHNLFKQHPYVAYKTMAALKNYSADELRKSLFKILDADLRLKTTGHDPKLVLETLLVELCMPKVQ